MPDGQVIKCMYMYMHTYNIMYIHVHAVYMYVYVGNSYFHIASEDDNPAHSVSEHVTAS